MVKAFKLQDPGEGIHETEIKEINVSADDQDGTFAAKESCQFPRAAVREISPLPDFTRWGPVDRHPLRFVRRSTVKQMALTWPQIPHVMHKDATLAKGLETLCQQRHPLLSYVIRKRS
jgi:pyruvate dehydrogenase E2 component (dihydrolipoamide acetyltransferase)